MEKRKRKECIFRNNEVLRMYVKWSSTRCIYKIIRDQERENIRELCKPKSSRPRSVVQVVKCDVLHN